MNKRRARRIGRKTLSKFVRRSIKLFKGELRARSFYWYILPSIQNALKVHKAIVHKWRKRNEE